MVLAILNAEKKVSDSMEGAESVVCSDSAKNQGVVFEKEGSGTKKSSVSNHSLVFGSASVVFGS